jgi:hypothetical protein
VATEAKGLREDKNRLEQKVKTQEGVEQQLRRDRKRATDAAADKEQTSDALRESLEAQKAKVKELEVALVLQTEKTERRSAIIASNTATAMQRTSEAAGAAERAIAAERQGRELVMRELA